MYINIHTNKSSIYRSKKKNFNLMRSDEKINDSRMPAEIKMKFN